MSIWPSLEHVDDRLLAQGLRSGDPNALMQVCDAYAARLYDYCHALMRDQESATQTLHDSLLAAQAHVGQLRDPELFRGWLYALVRSQCLRRLADPARPTGGQEAPEIEEQIFDPAAIAQREETRQLVHSALAGLNGKQREAIDLVLRHHLAPEELAGVLGLSTEQATELAWQARERLDDAFAAAILVHGGHSQCPSVAALVPPQEWPLSPATSRKLVRHIESCPVCADQRRPKASTAELLEVLEALPVALLPADLEHRVLATATDPALAAHRESIAQAAGPLDEWGWPTVAEPPSRRGGGRGSRDRDPDDSPRMWPAIAAAVGVILIVGVVYLILPSSSNSKPSAATTASAGPSDTATVSPDPSQSITQSVKPTPTRHSPSPSPTLTTHSAAPKPTQTRPKPTKTPTKGTLQVTNNGCTNVPAGQTHCTMTVTAVGGNVASWSATGSGVTAVGGGTLSKGQQGHVDVSFGPGPPCTTPGTVTFTPNGSAKVTLAC